MLKINNYTFEPLAYTNHLDNGITYKRYYIFDDNGYLIGSIYKTTYCGKFSDMNTCMFMVDNNFDTEFLFKLVMYFGCKNIQSVEEDGNDITVITNNRIYE